MVTGGTGVNGLIIKPKITNFAEFLAFWDLVWIGFPNFSQKDPSFGKLGHIIKPLTPVTFC